MDFEDFERIVGIANMVMRYEVRLEKFFQGVKLVQKNNLRKNMTTERNDHSELGFALKNRRIDCCSVKKYFKPKPRKYLGIILGYPEFLFHPPTFQFD